MEVKYKLLESYFDSKKLSNIKQIYENNEYKKRGEYYEIIISEIDSDIELITDELQKKLVTPFLKTYFIGNYENNIYILILVDNSEVEEIIMKIKTTLETENYGSVKVDNPNVSPDIDGRKAQREFILKNRDEVEQLKKDIQFLSRYQYKLKNSIEIMSLLLMIKDKAIIKSKPITIDYKTYKKYYIYYQKLSQEKLKIPVFEAVYDFIQGSFQNQRKHINSIIKILDELVKQEKAFSEFRRKNLKIGISFEKIMIIEKENILGYRELPKLKR